MAKSQHEISKEKSTKKEKENYEEFTKEFGEKNRENRRFSERVERNKKVYEDLIEQSQKIEVEVESIQTENVVNKSFEAPLKLEINIEDYPDFQSEISQKLTNTQKTINKSASERQKKQANGRMLGIICTVVIGLMDIGELIYSLATNSDKTSFSQVATENDAKIVNDEKSDLYTGNWIYALFNYEANGKTYPYDMVPEAYKKQLIQLFYIWLDEVSEQDFWETVAQYVEKGFNNDEGTLEYPTLADQIYYCNCYAQIAKKSDDELWQWESCSTIQSLIDNLVQVYNSSTNKNGAQLYRQVWQMGEGNMPRWAVAQLMVMALLQILEK